MVSKFYSLISEMSFKFIAAIVQSLDYVSGSFYLRSDNYEDLSISLFNYPTHHHQIILPKPHFEPVIVAQNTKGTLDITN
jgi:hypothetical protein